MEADETLGAAFPSVPEDWLQQIVFKLSYRQHGGSGLGFPPEYVEGLDYSVAMWYVQKLDEVREAEADALKSGTG